MNRTKQLIYILLISALTAQAQIDSIRMFMFGHSLVEYSSDITTNDEGKIAHWIYKLAAADDHFFAGTGQWGFLPQHAQLPPIAAWGYAQVPPVWDSDQEPFSAANFNRILITAANFAQWQAPNLEYPGIPGVSPISATEDIIDWVQDQEDEVKFYLYLNWPDLAPFLNNGFPASQAEFDAYNAYCIGEFQDWWLDYQDALLLSRPEVNVRMIPVGPIISKLLGDLLPEPIPTAELYEDDAPHGKASIYFLAGLITYMAIFENPASEDFQIPNTIHPDLVNHYPQIIDFIWEELLAFNIDEESRVFCTDQTVTSTSGINPAENLVNIWPNPTSTRLQIKGDSNGQAEISIYNMLGVQQLSLMTDQLDGSNINVEGLKSGSYLLRIFYPNTAEVQTKKLLIQR